MVRTVLRLRGARPRCGHSLFAVAALTLGLINGPAWGQTLVMDTYDVPGSGSGFDLNTGVNTGVNPPTTRLTGTAVAGLRYLPTANKAVTAFGLAGGKLRVAPAANPGRFVLSDNGSTSFDFSGALGLSGATPQAPAVYELAIRMANNSPGGQRCSFALGVAEGDATTWDFGLQIYRANPTDNFYTIGKRIDTAASGLAADLNRFITNTPPGSYGSELEFLLRVTDAGAETGAFSSRAQVSLDGGITWFYDTAADPDLLRGWRFLGPGRHVMWDVAPDAGPVAYDGFSLVRPPIATSLVAPADGAPGLGAAPSLRVAVTNTTGGDLTLVFHGREAPKPYPGPDFAMVVLPDTQNYAREAPDAAAKEMWIAQTEWVVTNRVAQNIAYVAHLGDVVQNGDIKDGNPNRTEWRNATNAMYRLENEARALRNHGVPYGVAVGNHDQEPIDDPDGTTTLFNEYFGVDHFQGRPYYGGNYGNNNDSHFDLFSASGVDFIVLYFENERYGSSIMNWANAVLSTNQNRFAIAVAHYMGGVATPLKFSAQGSAIYNGLRQNPKFFLMLGGHITGEGSRADTFSGNTVRTFVSDYQGRANGGSGWMRLLYFSPSNNTVTVQTYSPWLNKYETDDNSEMFFPLNLQAPAGAPGTPFIPLGTNQAVTSGSVSSLTWTGLVTNKTYEWYVVATDEAGNRAASPRWQFRTAVNTPPVASNLVFQLVGDQSFPLALTAYDANADQLNFRITLPTQGLITGFDTNTGVLTYTPARGFRGLDLFSFSASDGWASALGTVRLGVANPPDANLNGVTDAWEAAYGINDLEADPDHDGMVNRAEFAANTNPTNTASGLRVRQAELLPGGHFQLTWASVGGVRYRAQYLDPDAASGVTGSFVDIPRFIDQEMDPGSPGAPSTMTFVDDFTQTGNPAGKARYYRVRVFP